MKASPGIRGASLAEGSPRGASVEIQVHPADIRRRVRYFFLGRREVTALALAFLAYLLFLALGAGLAPLLLRRSSGVGEYQILVTERMRQGQRMQELVRRLDQLAGRGDELGLELARVRLAYGLPQRAGSAPRLPAAPEPETIYAAAVLSGRRLSARIEGIVARASADLRELERFEREHREEVATTPAACPLPAGSYVLTTPFGRARSPFTQELELHTGVDLAAAAGTPVRAPADGTVAFAGVVPMAAGGLWRRLGNLVILDHGGRWATVFGHLDRIDVRPGERVRRGAALGTVGSSGLATHAHVHYEVRRLGAAGERPFDPRLLMLDQTWPGQERLLAQAAGPPPQGFEPLPAPRRDRRQGGGRPRPRRAG